MGCTVRIHSVTYSKLSYFIIVSYFFTESAPENRKWKYLLGYWCIFFVIESKWRCVYIWKWNTMFHTPNVYLTSCSRRNLRVPILYCDGFSGEIHTNQLAVGRNKINVQLIISTLSLRDEVGVERCCGTDCLEIVRTVIHVLIQWHFFRITVVVNLVPSSCLSPAQIFISVDGAVKGACLTNLWWNAAGELKLTTMVTGTKDKFLGLGR